MALPRPDWAGSQIPERTLRRVTGLTHKREIIQQYITGFILPAFDGDW